MRKRSTVCLAPTEGEPTDNGSSLGSEAPEGTVNFDREKHEFTDQNGIIIPSVTQIIGDIGLVDTRWYTADNADRGSSVHYTLELYDKEELDWGSVPSPHMAFIEWWEKYKETHDLHFQDVEKIIFNKTYRYAGIADRIASNGEVYEIKTGQPHNWHDLQVTAYSLAIGDFRKSTILYFGPKGITEKTVENPKLVEVWKSCLNLYYWKRT